MKRGKYTPKQWLYARERLGGRNKRQSMLNAHYSKGSLKNTSLIENSEGVQLVMAELATKAGNLAMGAMLELQARGFEYFENKDLIRSLTALSNALAKFTPPKEKDGDLGNVLRDMLVKQKARTIEATAQPVPSVEPNPFDVD